MRTFLSLACRKGHDALRLLVRLLMLAACSPLAAARWFANNCQSIETEKLWSEDRFVGDTWYAGSWDVWPSGSVVAVLDAPVFEDGEVVRPDNEKRHTTPTLDLAVSCTPQSVQP